MRRKGASRRPRRRAAARPGAPRETRGRHRSAGPSWSWGAIGDSMLDGVFTTDLDGRILQCNSTIGRMLGKAKDDIVGEFCWKVIYGGDLALDPSLPEVVKDLRRVSVVHVMAGRTYGIRIDPLQLPSAGAVGAIHIVSDISERMAANRALAKSRDDLKAIVEASPAAIFVLDGEGRVLSWNRSAEHMLGWREDEIRDIVAGLDENRNDDLALWRRVLAGEVLTNLTGKWRRKDGIFLDVVYSMAPLHVDGDRPDRLIVIAADVTDLRSAEEALHQREVEVRQLQKMEAIGRFAGGMAHDLNNMLTVILGYADLMSDRPALDEATRAEAKMIRDASQRAADLCRNLLTFSQRHVVTTEALRLDDIIAEAMKFVRPLLSEDVQVTIRSDPETWPVKANRTNLHQVLMNLALNAREAMPAGGLLIVETANVRLDERYTERHPGTAPGDYSVMIVSDTGVGMSPSLRERIFEPFFTTKKGGTGLGLSVTYGMVAQAGGHIGVYSEPAQGSTFKVYLPRTADAAGSPRAATEGAAVSRGGTETILAVEDRPQIRSLIRDILTERGYRIVVVESGQEALRILTGGSLDVRLLVTDVVMPGMSGPELIRETARIRPGMKILVVSGYPQTVLTERGTLGGQVPFLNKPFSPGDLARKVREVLDS